MTQPPDDKSSKQPANKPAELLALARQGDRLALARLMSLVERGAEGARQLAALAFAALNSSTSDSNAADNINTDTDNTSTGSTSTDTGGGAASHTVGITGSPGAGKSSIVSELLIVARQLDQQIAVLAVDPSSPFTGGAILGDRVRMNSHTSDEGVYIRSMASRGQLGGLSLAVPLAARVLAAAGWPWVLIETVGVGQVEVDIASAADTTVVVVNPGWGDSVQANKAGLMEIADIFVINKSDRQGVAETRMDILQMLELSAVSAPASEHSTWEPPIVETIGTNGQGVGELWDAITAHRNHLVDSGLLAKRRQAQAENELAEALKHHLGARVAQLEETPAGADIKHKVLTGQLDPYAAAAELIDKTLG